MNGAGGFLGGDMEALAKVAHDAWCSEDDWDELDGDARGDWVNVARDVIAAYLAAPERTSGAT